MKNFFTFVLSLFIFLPSLTFAVDVGLNCPIVWQWSSTGYTSCTGSGFPVNPPGTSGTVNTPGNSTVQPVTGTLSCDNDGTNQNATTNTTINFIDRGCWKPGNESTHVGGKCNCGTGPNAAGTITGSLTLNASAPSGGQCTVTGSASASVSSGTTEKRAQMHFNSLSGGLNSQGGIPSTFNINPRTINVGSSITGFLGESAGWGPEFPATRELDRDTVTCGSGTGPGTGYCGDSLVQNPNAGGGLEQCDLGLQNGVAGSSCSATCQTVSVGGLCGNFVVNSPEQCDLGTQGVQNPAHAFPSPGQNGVAGSGCSTTCQSTGVSCGNGTLDSGEACDASASNGQCSGNSTCNSSCTCVTTGTPGYNIACASGVSCNGVFQPGSGTAQPTCVGVNSNAQYSTLAQCQNGLSNSSCPAMKNITVTATPPVVQSGGMYTTNLSLSLNASWQNFGPSFGSNAYAALCEDGSSFLTNCGPFLSPVLYSRNITKVSDPFAWNPGQSKMFYGGVVTGQWNGTNTDYYEDFKCSVDVNANPNNTPINIGWTSNYTPKDKTVPALATEILYVNTEGRTNCSISGAMTVSPVSFSSYAVNNQPAGNYSYALTCPGVASPVSATLNVTPSGYGPSVTCSPSPQNVPATFTLGVSGFTLDPTCNVTLNGVPDGSVMVPGTLVRSTPGTYVVTCSRGGQSASANCVAQTPTVINSYACISNACSTACGGKIQPECTFASNGQCSASGCGGGSCGDEICSASECGSCVQDCLNSPVCTDGAECVNVTASPNPVVIGRDTSVTISATVLNTGNSIWSNQYKLRKIGGTLPTIAGPISMINPNVIPGQSRIFSITATVPATAGTYSTQWRLEDNAGNVFGDMCPSATLNVPVVLAACVNGANDDGAADGMDCDDPQCNLNGVAGQCCNGQNGRPLWNSETDQCGTTTNHTLTANPQLIRQGGTSQLRWTTGGATGCYLSGLKAPLSFGGYNLDVNSDGTMDGWTIAYDGSADVTGIQSKLTYQLYCSSVPRSATISVIKINEI